MPWDALDEPPCASHRNHPMVKDPEAWRKPRHFASPSASSAKT